MVRTIAIKPTLLVFSSWLKKYFIPGIRPRGGRKMLNK